MLNLIKFSIPLILMVIAFFAGHEYGSSKVEKAWAEADNEALKTFQEQAEKAMEAKNNEIKTLNNDLAAMSQSRADIVRKLDAYKARERTIEQCKNDRARMADLAVGLDDFAQRLVVRTRSMMK